MVEVFGFEIDTWKAIVYALGLAAIITLYYAFARKKGEDSTPGTNP